MVQNRVFGVNCGIEVFGGLFVIASRIGVLDRMKLMSGFVTRYLVLGWTILEKNLIAISFTNIAIAI